jgi:hypothetical protein
MTQSKPLLKVVVAVTQREQCRYLLEHNFIFMLVDKVAVVVHQTGGRPAVAAVLTFVLLLGPQIMLQVCCRESSLAAAVVVDTEPITRMLCISEMMEVEPALLPIPQMGTPFLERRKQQVDHLLTHQVWSTVHLGTQVRTPMRIHARLADGTAEREGLTVGPTAVVVVAGTEALPRGQLVLAVLATC